MNRTLWALLALVLLAPAASAEPNPAQQRDTVIQTPAGVVVIEQLHWADVSAAAYDGQARFYVPAGASNVAAALYPDVGIKRDVPSGNVTLETSDIAGFDLLRVDLTSLQPTVPDGSDFEVGLTYHASTTALVLRTRYAVADLRVFASPLEGNQPASDTFETFVPAALNTFHGVKANVAAKSAIDVSFVPAGPGAAAGDVTTWVWGGGGLLVGLLGMWIALRQGWVASGGRAAKFQKGGSMEPRAMLEARRRTLLAALKELETAHESKDVLDAAYFPLKEEYKQQAVRVMRNLEEKKE